MGIHRLENVSLVMLKLQAWASSPALAHFSRGECVRG
jgi:hypothetical protein